MLLRPREFRLKGCVSIRSQTTRVGATIVTATAVCGVTWTMMAAARFTNHWPANSLTNNSYGPYNAAIILQWKKRSTSISSTKPRVSRTSPPHAAALDAGSESSAKRKNSRTVSAG